MFRASARVAKGGLKRQCSRLVTAATQSRRPFAVFSQRRRVISPSTGPAAVGPYSPGVSVLASERLLFVSGQIGLLEDGTLPPGASEQSEVCLQNLGRVLSEGKSSFDRVVKTSIYLSDMALFEEVNAVYEKFFPIDPPARACFAVAGLPKGALVEIEAVAICEAEE